MRQRRRWSDNDKHFGPFLYSRDRESKSWGAVIDSGHDEHAGCHLRLRGFGHTLIVELPSIIKPWQERIVAGWDPATVERMGRDWYINEDAREYGFNVSYEGGTGFLQIFMGRQSDSSKTTQNWSCFLPWTDWRHVRLSFYDAKGDHFWTEWDVRDNRYRPNWSARLAAEKACPAVTFEFDDFDGKRIKATTRIQEREWHFGTKWCKWLSWFRKPMIRRSLNIEFSEEVGPEKGSWKGGTMGTGIDLLPGEQHEEAFRRFCDKDHRSKYRSYRIAFVGRA